MRILSFGGGVDSSAILLTHLMVEDLGIDHVVFSDTGAESRGTYKNVALFQQLCSNQNLPFTIVKHHQGTITDWVLDSGSLPTMVGAKHICSARFKGKVIAQGVKSSFPADEKITYLIGIEADEGARSERFQKPEDDTAEYEYPLIDKGMTRQDCLDLIASFGLEIPKSSCVFCPFMSREEILEIRNDSEAWATIKLVESRFQEGSAAKHQAWLDGGRQLIMLRPDGWKKGNGKVTKGKGKKGDHCKIGYKSPNGQWRQDSWSDGMRLFQSAKVNGKMLSVEEWEKETA